MPFLQHVLPNGLTLIGEHSPQARSVALGFFVKTGSRDEKPEEWGLSHFLEHMVFKGTPRRSALDVNLDFDRIGASYNAFTSEENTVFYAAVLPEYLPQAVDILADILRPSLRGEDFDMEKNVILEEIAMYDDQPFYCAYEKAKQAYFGSHPLGKSVLGTTASITSMTRDAMQAYFDRRYVGSNITVSIAGQFDWAQVIAHVEKLCAGWPKGTAPRGDVQQPKSGEAFEVVTKEKAAQEQIFMLSPAPAADAPLRHAADLVSAIVGDDTNSRLYWELVDPGLADSADMSYHDYEGAGAYFTSMSCEPANVEENLRRVRAILTDVQANGVSADELAIAKSKYLSRVVRGNERPSQRMSALGMSWTYLHTYRSVDDELRDFEAVTLADIRKALDTYPFDRIATVALGPLAKVTKPAGTK